MKYLSILIYISFLNVQLFCMDFITLGTGEINGTYYPTGNYLCKFINQIKKETNIRCSVESTGGSVHNINAIRDGKFNFAISQSDTIYQAINGINTFDKKPIKKLRSVMGLYSELFTLVTRKDVFIRNIEDIKGKRINLGSTKSGSEFSTLELFKEYGINRSDLLIASSLQVEDTEDAFIDNKIDGFFFMVGHPANNIKNPAKALDIFIVPIQDKIIDNFIQKYPYFSKAIIPAFLYKGVNKPIPTFSVKAVLLTSEDTSDILVYTFVKTILDNFEEFKTLHPSYKYITKKSLVEGLSAPLHKASKKYFKEIGLL